MNDRLNDRLTEAARYIGNLGQELRSMQVIGKNIEDLRSVFMNSKLRGNFGEQVLNDMLANNFPKEQFELQHKFKDGQTVDAIVRTKDGLIPVDSKFPVDSFRRMLSATTEDARAAERNEFYKAVKKHLGDIAKKYILPGEGTTNFAVMYVPSEACYYEIVAGPDDLSELAQRSRVLMVSPNTLSYFLHVLRLGHERIRIEENVQKIWELLAGFHQETMKFGEQLGVLSRHITNAQGAMDTAQAAYDRLAGKVDQIKRLK
jgi:DNA recombination protein RmuC